MLSLWKPFSFSKLVDDLFSQSWQYPDTLCSSLGLEHRRESDGTFITTVDLPGVSDQDVSVETSKGYVIVKGSKKTKTSSYAVSKVFSIPEDCNADELKAELKDGVLTLSMPGKVLSASSEVKKIPVTVSK